MGNLFPIGLLNTLCIRPSIYKNRDLLQIVRADGKMIKFKAPVLVKDLLINFEKFGVGSSKKASSFLSPCFELKLGKVYYLLSPKPLKYAQKPTISVSPEFEAKLKSGAVSRVKILTKQQLHELLSKKRSTEKNCPTNWKPRLTSIPEGNELN